MQRKTFTKDIKQAIVHELQAGKTVAQVCREYEVNVLLRSPLGLVRPRYRPEASLAGNQSVILA